jgi:hypothetical protein
MPDVVLTQLIFLMMSTGVLETCSSIHLRRVTYTKCRINTTDSPDDEHRGARNMQRIGINPSIHPSTHPSTHRGKAKLCPCILVLVIRHANRIFSTSCYIAICGLTGSDLFFLLFLIKGTVFGKRLY